MSICSTPPSGPAGGDLAGTYPNPRVIAIEETSDPARLTIGAIPNGTVLVRSGTSVVGVSLPVIDDHQVVVSAADTTPGYLGVKVTTTGGLTQTTLNPAGNEQLQIDGSTIQAAAAAAQTTANTALVDAIAALAQTAALRRGSFTVLTPLALPTTGGEVGGSTVTTATNFVAYIVDSFVAGSKTSGWSKLCMPADWDGNPFTAVFIWDSTSGASGDVVWGIAGTAYADGGTIDVAAGTAVEVTDTYDGAGKMNVSTQTAAITLGGTPAVNAPTLLQIYRLGTGADTLAATVRLLMVQIRYTKASS